MQQAKRAAQTQPGVHPVMFACCRMTISWGRLLAQGVKGSS
jgi:hypothetical protein